MAEFSLDRENKTMYGARAEEWKAKIEAYYINYGEIVYYDELNDYIIQIDDYEYSINKQLPKSARKVAKNGSENSYEYAAIIDLDSGKEVDFGTSEEYSNVNSYYKFLMSNLHGRYAMIHNHNTESSLSLLDIQELVMWENLECICTVTNNGISYSVLSNGIQTKNYIYIEFEDCAKDIKDIKERELAMVKEAIKKFGKREVIVIDGRRNN